MQERDGVARRAALRARQRRDHQLLRAWQRAHRQHRAAAVAREKHLATADRAIERAMWPFGPLQYHRAVAYLEKPNARGFGPAPREVMRAQRDVERAERRLRPADEATAAALAAAALACWQAGEAFLAHAAPQGIGRSVPRPPTSAAVGFGTSGREQLTITEQECTMTDATATRLSEIQAAESEALAAVAAAEKNLTRKQERIEARRVKEEAEMAQLRTDLEAAQGAFAHVAGPERAATVLGISVAAARTRAKVSAGQPMRPGEVDPGGLG